MKDYDWVAHIKAIEQENIAAGKCPNCGGSGVVAAMAAINRTGDPHLNRRCPKCQGTGKPKAWVGPQEPTP